METRSLKIQIGSGGNLLPGWINTDSAYTDPALRVDAAKPLPWPSECATNVFMEHILEHLSGPDALRCLDECFRILKPGGVIRVCVPAIDRLLREKKLGRDDTLNHGHLIFFSTTSLSALLGIAGFCNVSETERKDCDGHWKVIGKERDDAETLRMEGIK